MDKYKILIRRISDVLKLLGLTKSGTTFYIKENDNWGLIDFQKSRNSVLGEIKFTINIGICSEKIRSFLDGINRAKPDLESCHWQNRVGFLLPQKRDYWWTINEFTNIDALKSEIEDVIVSYCIPEIKKFISDESLERVWLNRISPGIGELQRFIYLTTLLKCYGRSNLNEIAMALRDFSFEKPFEDRVLSHLKKLGI